RHKVLGSTQYKRRAGMNPFGRRVATFVVACLAFDLWGYAVYHAWRTQLIGAVPALIVLTVMAVLGLGCLALGPRWIGRAPGVTTEVTEPSEPPPKARPWLVLALGLGSIAAGAGLDAWGRFVFPPVGAPAGTGELAAGIAINAACVGFLVFTVIRLSRPGALRPVARRFALALAIFGTIEAAARVAGGVTLPQLLSARFAYAVVQMGIIYVPLCLWAGYIWGRIMSAIFTPPRR